MSYMATLRNFVKTCTDKEDKMVNDALVQCRNNTAARILLLREGKKHTLNRATFNVKSLSTDLGDAQANINYIP